MLSKEILTVVPYSIRVIRKLSAGQLDSGLTFQQYRILYFVGQGFRPTEMAEILQVSMAAISKMTDTLLKKKLIVKGKGVDRRCSDLQLTTAGKKILKIVTGELENLFESKLKKLTKRELTELGQGLSVLQKLMGQLNEN